MRIIHRVKDFIAYASAILSPLITVAKLNTIKNPVLYAIIDFLYSEPMKQALAYLLLISMINMFLVLFIAIAALMRRSGRHSISV